MARILIGNIKGPKGNQGIQGIQGPIGPVGPQGPLPPLANNGLTTQAGAAALDAAYGKTLADGLSLVNSEILIGEAVYGPFTFPHGVSYYDVKIPHPKEGYNIISANITTLGVPTYRVSLGITLYLIDDINLGIRIDNADPNTLESHIAVQFVFKRAK